MKGCRLLQGFACGQAGLVVALCLAAVAAFAQKIDVPLAFTEDTLFVDPDGTNQQCVAGDMSNRDGALPTVPVPALKPGVYRCHVRLKVSHTCIPATARLEYTLQLTASGSVLAGRHMTIVDFERPARYQEFVFPVAVPPGTGPLAFRAQWSWPQIVNELSPKRKFDKSDLPTLDAAGVDIDMKKSQGKEVRIERPLAELKYHLACDSLWFEPVNDAAIGRFDLYKACYRPGETAALNGVIVNYAPEARPFTLRIERLCALEAPEVITNLLVMAPAGGQVPFKTTVPMGDRPWDREIRGILTDADGREVARISEFRAVHSNLWAVAVGGGYKADITEYRAKGYYPKMGQPLEGIERYLNQVEFVFWAPDDTGDFTPEGHFYSGQTRRDNGEESTRQLTEFFRSRGVASSVYARIATPGGKAGYNLLRRFPDWNDPASYDVAQLDRWDRSKSLSIWPQLTVKPGIDEPYKNHARELIESHRQFGWAAARYDDRADTAAHLQLVKSLVNAAVPEFQWGYNSGHPAHYPPGLFDTQCAGGGLIMEEANVHAFKDRWTYDKYASRHIEFRDRVHPRGGHLAFCPAGDQPAHNDTVYQQFLPLCARAHHAWLPAPTIPWGADYARFSVRYCGQLWDNRYTAVTNAARFIDWGEATPRLFKWSSYVYVRPTGMDTSELIMHLVNQPPERVAAYDDARVPDPVETLEGTITLPDGLEAAAAWRLSAELEPEQLSLPIRKDGGRVVIRVPKLRFWNLIVVQMTGNGRWP